MLKQLSIRNYAIIDELDIRFDAGLNILTGETGAGKSIILGALSMVLGERADTKVLFHKEAKCLVEATFDAHTAELKNLLHENDLDVDAQTVLRREINAAGKSRAFVNDTPVSLQVMKSVGALLVNLHSQHETLELMQAGFQLNTIDAIAGNKSLLAEYQPLFADYKRMLAELSSLEAQQQSATSENDYLLFQLNELNEANLQLNEQKELEEELGTLSNAEAIKASLQKAFSLMDESDVSITSLLAEVGAELKAVQNFNTQLHALHERLQTVIIELKDLSRETEKLNDEVSVQPLRLQEVNERLMLLHRLCKKHQVTDADALLPVMEKLETKVGKIANLEAEIEKLRKQIIQLEKELKAKAEKLHTQRVAAASGMLQAATALLKNVGMPDAAFDVAVSFSPDRQLTSTGFSEVEFLFSANKGIAPQPLKSVASGGELSRLMLCIKSLLADAGALPTMIFDEIDTGISGEVAKQVGVVMKQLSKHHQLICITHLPQIATAGSAHYFIFKDNSSGIARTRIRKLNEEERVMEIAKMLSGNKLTDAALANARELMSV